MNYLELVNKTIQESGVDLDDLTSVNFASPVPTKMYPRFKNWVSDAWEDIQLGHNEWEFVSSHAVVQIYPRFLVRNGARATAPPVGSTYTSASGGLTFTVVDETLVSGTWAGGDAVAILDVEDIGGASGNPLLLESYNELTPTPASDKFAFEFFGRYDFKDFVTDLDEVEKGSFSIQNEGGGVNQLVFIPWATWLDNGFEMMQSVRGMPQYFTETPEGKYDFYPRPDAVYTLTFDYVKNQSTLVGYSDTPSGIPYKYHRAIVWLALQYYADYDENTKLWAKAKRKYDSYLATMERDLSPVIAFGSSRYNYPTWG